MILSFTYENLTIQTPNYYIMKLSTQSENITSHFTREMERQKAIKALEKAKSIKRKVVFLPMGATGNLNIREVF